MKYSRGLWLVKYFSPYLNKYCEFTFESSDITRSLTFIGDNLLAILVNGQVRIVHRRYLWKMRNVYGLGDGALPPSRWDLEINGKHFVPFFLAEIHLKWYPAKYNVESEVGKYLAVATPLSHFYIPGVGELYKRFGKLYNDLVSFRWKNTWREHQDWIEQFPALLPTMFCEIYISSHKNLGIR